MNRNGETKVMTFNPEYIELCREPDEELIRLAAYVCESCGRDKHRQRVEAVKSVFARKDGPPIVQHELFYVCEDCLP